MTTAHPTKIWFRLAMAILVLGTRPAVGADTASVRVPDGFQVSLYADDELAHDIYSMTVDARGRVVVSGAGYVRILVDRDRDGKADHFKSFVDGPKTGAQGLYFDGHDLICTGDAGLIRYRDRDGDDRADGPAEVLLKIKTGGEHHVHAVQKGPDGYWYVIAGNYAGVSREYVTSARSPISQPNAGTLLRLSPGFEQVEVLADGFRNAYDFAFDRWGDMFVYDSDGERDASLPWYRPTRVFQALPGSSAGWFSRSWKRPDYFADMPPVVAHFGRGSPTGVVCYRHDNFPAPYRDAVFVLDWTFGRVLAVPLIRKGSVWTSEPIEFMTGVGQFGFAPTDIAVGTDGSLYVCVGGRGTRGGVFRIKYGADDRRAGRADRQDDPLLACLRAPQPLSSWSRAEWIPRARQAGRAALAEAARNETLPHGQRVRAIEILTEVFGGLDPATMQRVAAAQSSDVRARAAWAWSRLARPAPSLLVPLLRDEHPLVARSALEALLAHDELAAATQSSWVTQLESSDRFVRQAAARLVARLVDSELELEGARARLTFHLGRVTRSSSSFQPSSLLTGLEILQQSGDPETQLEAVRLMQLALGDVGPGGRLPPVLEGYQCRLDLRAYRRELLAMEPRLLSMYPTGHRLVDLELSRLIAMLAPTSSGFLDRVLGQINEVSHPTDDIHHLIAAARIPALRNDAQRASIATTLLHLELKVGQRQLKQDSNWEPRISELYEQLVERDPRLPRALVEHPAFGRPDHMLYLQGLSGEDRRRAVRSLVRQIGDDPDYPWSSQVIQALGRSDDPRHLELVRGQYENPVVRSAVLLVLSRNVQPQDRGKFVEGLQSSQLDVLEACLRALQQLPASQDADEQFALLSNLRRLNRDEREYALREQAVRLLRRNVQRDFGFQFGKAGYGAQGDVVRRWTDWLHVQYPDHDLIQDPSVEEDLSGLQAAWDQVPWETGNLDRGRAMFQRRSCGQCHGSRRALGPDLSGVTRRFSRRDLFTAIVAPNHDVSPRYQTTLVETTDGRSYIGLVIYDSVDGVTMRSATNQTFRIEAEEIELRRQLGTSLMPGGLLRDCTPGELADLYAYLRSLDR